MYQPILYLELLRVRELIRLADRTAESGGRCYGKKGTWTLGVGTLWGLITSGLALPHSIDLA